MSYLKIFSRQLLKHKLFSAIIIGGLSIGLASCLVLILYINDELSYDRHHPDADRIYRMSTIFSDGNEELPISGNGARAADLLSNAFTEIRDATRINRQRYYVSLDAAPDEGSFEQNLYFADANVFDLFSFRWVAGDPGSALNDPDTIVLTRDFARKYFGAADPLNRTLLLNNTEVLRVTGVIDGTATTSHVVADAFIAMPVLERLRGEGYFNTWFNLDFQTYIRLDGTADFAVLEPLMFETIIDNRPPQANSIFRPDSERLEDIYLDGNANPWSQRSRKDDLFILMGICAGLLLIGCINFINLATSRTAERLKEIAIRKISGSRQRQIFWQHMGESAVMVCIAFLLGIGMSELALPVVNGYTDKRLTVSDLATIWPLVIFLGVTVTASAGAYPALVLSRARPLAVFRHKGGGRGGRLSLRNLLVICQFAIAIVMIIATLVMLGQLRFARNVDLGFDKERILVLQNSTGDNWQAFKREILGNTEVQMVSAGLGQPFSPLATSAMVRYEGLDAPSENLSQFQVDFGYFELFGVNLLAGRYFSDRFGTDRAALPDEEQPHPPAAIMMNKAMVDRLGWTPEEAIGKWFEMSSGPVPGFDRSVMGEIVGVVENMQSDSVRREVVPQFYFVPAVLRNLDYIFLKLPPGNTASQVDAIRAIWRDIYPDQPINQHFLDASFQALYEVEERQAALVSAFALLMVAISCMGLLGLAAYTTEKRIKEIGIRKTIGATVMQIVLLLSHDFSKLVLIANVIAWPVAYVAMSRWLESFAYRIDLTPVVFVGSGLIALCIAWVTVGGTAAKAASQRPVLALRYE